MAVVTRQRQYHQQDLWDKFWKDKHGNVVIWQMPSALLWGWVVITMASLFVPHGVAEDVLYVLSEVVLATWAIVETLKGVNYFRRSLGAIVLLFVIMGALHKI